MTLPTSNPHFSLPHVIEAHSWLSDCFGDQVTEQELTFASIVQGIDRHYEGGWPEFFAACGI